mmetsp:Transcript_16678/g.19302  ORF Transcript_16678/g.19302 Transcript_16678/m.19302 type:complete len:146 (+) Transcript_16678:605-1042(+)
MHTGYSAKASWNSIKVNVIGSKYITFKDGTKITWNNMEDQICNTLFGQMTRQVTGKQEYTDEANGITAFIETGTKKVQDYIVGSICQYGHEIYKVTGNYNGYIEFNGKRYWDIRETRIYEIIPSSEKTLLPSDSRNRLDILILKT